MKKCLILLCLIQISCCVVDRTWWKYTTLYEVFLPSFKDGNGDGMGDIKGLTSKLDHFVDLGIETIYISPHYESPMVDSGYDITDFTAVNSLMGTMEDFETLIREMKSKGLKLIIDLILNHCSDRHPWFIKSVNGEDPYTDYFIWKDPKGYNETIPLPPNNWLNVFGGSAWTWNDQRKQFYYHQFTAEQPDFDLRNKKMKNEIKKVLQFWLHKGVAGFRLDAVKHLLEDAMLRDEPVSSPDIKKPFKYQDLIHIYTLNLCESYEFLHELRTFVDKVCKRYKDFERIFISEDYIDGKLLYQYYGSEEYKIVHLPLNLNVLNFIITYQNASFYHEAINGYLSELPEGATPSWNSENHDKFRKAFVLNEEFEFIFASMVMMLPGMAYIYYGQEIGITGSKIRQDQVVNKFPDDFTHVNRDFFRQPMSWDSSLNAGFSTSNKPYLPLNPNYWRINVKDQKKDEHSYYQMFKKMVNSRKTDTLKYGNFKSYVISTWVFAFTRTLEEHTSYVVIYNLGSETEFIDLYNAIDDLPGSMTIEIASPNSGYKVGGEVPTTQEIPKILILRPFVTLVLSSRSPGV